MPPERLQLPRALSWPLLAAGGGALYLSLQNFHAAPADARLLLFTLVTLSFGTRFALRLPRADAHVHLSDAFVILSLFLFDAGVAVWLAALASLCSALRLTRAPLPLAAAASLGAVSAFCSANAFRLLPSAPSASLQSPQAENFALALGLAALVFAAFQTLRDAASGGNFLRRLAPHAAGSLAAHLALASLAGGAALVAARFGLAPFLAAAASLAALHFAHGAYLRNAEASAARAGVPPAPPREGQGDAQPVFRSAFEQAAVGMALVSPKGKWLRANRAFCDALGYAESELLARSFQEVVHPDDLGPALANLKDVLRGKAPAYRAEKRFINRHGAEVWMLWSVSRLEGGDRLILQTQDITDRKISEQQLLHNAFHDALTGLPNRALFIDHVKLTIARTKRREGRLFAVLFLDLDRFKVINDSLGHLIGDQLLVGIARRLEGCLREGDTVARVGGDEFTILLEDIEDEAEAVSVAERVQKELSAPFNLDGHEVFTTVSIGIAPSTTGYDDPEDLLRDADTAMYRAKSLGKARHEVFDRAMHAFTVNLLQLETDLRKALERREMFVLYQPIVALDDFRLCGFEALVRWQHPERGLISPMDFIPVAEDTGQIIAIGEWMLHESCRQMRRWQKLFPGEAPLFVSVNLSAKQFAQPNLTGAVAAVLEKTKLSPRCLKLEITESVVMENIEAATEMLRELRALGVQLAIDDFGTGYSSLSYLHRFPIDTLKIDRSFVTRMVDNSENIEIVRTIVMLAQILGMDVVAEGVETKEQLALLRKLGCENGQGYYFSRPATPTDAEKIIADTCARPQAAGARLTEKTAAPLTDDKVKSFRLHGEA
jgi:diguanylate cyclase (GGDEF)-like protein/PAS domain S-box-containing protein